MEASIQCNESEANEAEKKRNFVIMEIISTEKTYFSRLQALMDVFLFPLQKKNTIGQQEFRSSFGLIEVIYGIHREMCHWMIEEEKMPKPKMGKLFLAFINYLKVYKDYLLTFGSSLSSRAALMTTNKVRDYLGMDTCMNEIRAMASMPSLMLTWFLFLLWL